MAAALLLEAMTRVFYPEINLQNTSSNLFTPQAFGQSYGNARNVVASSFGSPVVTDKYGFRIDPQYPCGKKAGRPSLVFLGDSVVFGSGVPAAKTFVELINRNLPDYRAVNTAVIGYNVNNYRDVVDYFLLEKKEAWKIKRVILGLCLNDIQSVSNSNIVAASSQSEQTSPMALLNKIKSLDIGFLDFFKSHSKLFMLWKNCLLDSSKLYFQYDLQPYYSQRALDDMMAPLVHINHVLAAHNILFTVIIEPYEYQLRVPDDTTLYPNAVLGKLFEARGIDYRDGTAFFAQARRDRGLASKELFLYNDPMHFSPRGHQLMYELITRTVINR